MNKIVLKEYSLKTDKNIKTKIMLMSDIHFSSIFDFNNLDLIINKVMLEKPNYIVIPGDIIDGSNVLDDIIDIKMINFFKEISKLSKVIISLGNHDISYLLSNEFHTKWKYDKVSRFFNQIKRINNVYLLDNDIYEENNICFVGLSLSYEYYHQDEDKKILIRDINNLNSLLDKNKYNILLCHSPINILDDDVLNTSLVKDISLVLSGHMHNGIVPNIIDNIVKGNRGLIAPSKKLFPSIARGKVEKNGKTLIISGGITKFSYSSPNFFHPFNKMFSMNVEIININC